MREGPRWIRDMGELEEIVPRWSALWKADPWATPFQSPEWLAPWWRCFGTDLRTVALYRDDELIALLPFYLHAETATGERRLLPVGVGTSDYLDGVFAPQCRAEDVDEALEFLCAEDGWDALFASQLRAQSKLLQGLEHLGWGARFAAESCARMPAVIVSALPQKIRRNAMYYRNRAQRAGNLELSVAGAADWEEHFDALVKLHTERWRDSSQPGVFADQRVIQWHREALPLLHRAGVLRLYSLRLNGEPIGVIYSLIDPPDRPERTQYFYLPGYSLAYSELRPGTVLTALAIEKAAQEGVRVIDMLRGEEEYKRLWHTEASPTFGFQAFRDDVRTQGQSAGNLAA